MQSYRRLAKAPGSVPMSTTHVGGLRPRMARHAEPLVGRAPRIETALQVAWSLPLRWTTLCLPAQGVVLPRPSWDPQRKIFLAEPPHFPIS